MRPRSGEKFPGNSSGKWSIAGPKKHFAMKATGVGFSSPLQTRAQAIQSSLNNGIITSNRYQVGEKNLSEFNDDNDDESMNGAENVNKQNKDKKNNPIIIVGSNVTFVQNLCEKIVISKKYEIKLLGIGIKVTVSVKEEFEALLKALKEGEIKYFMYHTADSRPRKIILQGLHEMDLATLKEELAALHVNPTDIKTLRLRQNRYNYDKQCIYLLYFAPGSVKLSDLKNIRFLCNISVKWAPYSAQTHNKYPQCHNCQMYGHSSINCNMPSHCAVCAGDHKTDVCPKKIKRAVLQQIIANKEKVETSYLKCANCGNNHPATYNGCEARKAYVEVQKRLHQRTHRRSNNHQFHLNEVDFPVLEESRWAPQQQQPAHYQQQQPTHYPQHQSQQFQQQYSTHFQQQQSSNQQNDVNMQQFLMSMMATVNKLVDKISTMIEHLTKIIGNVNTPAQP